MRHESEAPIDPPRGSAWDIQAMREAWSAIHAEYHVLDCRGMLSNETKDLFLKLLRVLDADIDGMTHANRMG